MQALPLALQHTEPLACASQLCTLQLGSMQHMHITLHKMRSDQRSAAIVSELPDLCDNADAVDTEMHLVAPAGLGLLLEPGLAASFAEDGLVAEAGVEPAGFDAEAGREAVLVADPGREASRDAGLEAAPAGTGHRMGCREGASCTQGALAAQQLVTLTKCWPEDGASGEEAQKSLPGVALGALLLYAAPCLQDSLAPFLTLAASCAWRWGFWP